MGVVIVGGAKEVFEGKGASRHCDAAKHGAGIKTWQGPQIIDGADLGTLRARYRVLLRDGSVRITKT